MLVMVLQGHKSSPQKSRPLESGHRRHAVWIAIECYIAISWAKNDSEFKFLCELGWFCRDSHYRTSAHLNIQKTASLP